MWYPSMSLVKIGLGRFKFSFKMELVVACDPFIFYCKEYRILI